MHLTTPQLLAHDHFLGAIDAMQLKYLLCQIDPNSFSIHVDSSSVIDVFDDASSLAHLMP
jgi:hypothetical protein